MDKFEVGNQDGRFSRLVVLVEDEVPYLLLLSSLRVDFLMLDGVEVRMLVSAVVG
jgi:hypothetical protein